MNRAKWCYLLLFLAGVGDAATTYIGLSWGFVETRLFFVPFLATAILGLAVWFINRKWLQVPEKAKTVVCACLVTVGFSPVAWNLLVLMVG